MVVRSDATDLFGSLIWPALAGLLGATLAALIAEVVVGPALSAQGSRLEMGGIPLLLSALVFAPLLAAMVAGLLAAAHPYRAGLVAQVGLVAIAVIAQEMQGRMVTTLISPAALLFYIPIGLWGSLLVDPRLAGRAARFRAVRDGSLGFAVIISFFALLGAAIYWVPATVGLLLELLLLAAFYGWIAWRNRQGASRGRAP